MAALTVKQIVNSKTNWAALVITVLSFLADPSITSQLPADWAPWIGTFLKLSGPVIFILKSFFTKQVPIESASLVPGA